jgi:glutaconate CoA-transferase subunit A
LIGLTGSDYLKYRPDLKTVIDPYTGNEYVTSPAIIPDVGVIHGYKGDRFGGVTTHSYREDRLIAMAAEVTIAVVEELVEPDEVVPGLYEIYISPMHIDAVVVAKGGAHPTACPGRYGTDYKHLDAYVAAAKDDALFQQYLDEYVVGPEDHEAYLEKVRFEGYVEGNKSI